MSPTVETLTVARFVQGLAGAVGIVIAQAAGRDVYAGAKLLRYYGRLTVLGGLAAIIGPVIGGQLATVTDWRGVFLFLAAVGVAVLVASLVNFKETLPTNRRVSGGLSHTLQDFRRLLADRVFVGAVLITGFTYSAIFAYLSGATYILQGLYGLSPQGYSLAFGLNSLGFMVFGFIAGRLSERWSERGTLTLGLVMTAAGALGLLATALLHLPLAAIVLSLFTMASGVAVTSPPATSLALLSHFRDRRQGRDVVPHPCRAATKSSIPALDVPRKVSLSMKSSGRTPISPSWALTVTTKTSPRRAS
ncbi:UNVERIFIED_ORG: MFS family permease [Arthrobacter sp. UYCu721]